MTNDIKRYDFKPGLAVEFEIISLTQLYKKNKTALTAPHRASFYHIIWIEMGQSTHLIDFNPVLVKSHSILFVNKGNVHFFDPSETATGHVILFTDEFFCQYETDAKFLQNTILFHDLLENAPFLVGKSSSFDGIFQLMKAEVKNASVMFQRDLLRNLLHNFLMLADREKRAQGFKEIKKGADLDHTFVFRSFLETDFISLKSVHAYAVKMGISEKRLNQATSKILGKSPKELIDDRVLLEIKRLLVHSQQSIKEIGFATGFEEPTNFIKYFRKHTGTTPTDFRLQYSS